MAIFGDFLRPVFQRAACSMFQACILKVHSVFGRAAITLNIGPHSSFI